MRGLLILSCLFVVLAGCGGLPGQIDLVVENLTVQQQDDRVRFNGDVEVLGSRVSKFVAEDVKVVFENKSGDAVRTVQVGTIRDTDFRRRISVQLEKPPQKVLIRVGNVKTDGNLVLQGLRRTENGEYAYFEQDKDDNP